MQSEKGRRKVFVGTVVSTGMQKSVLVEVERTFAHPQYKKIMRKSRKFMAHDENEQCSVGDRVSIIEVRPLSKRKCWLVTEIIQKSH